MDKSIDVSVVIGFRNWGQRRLLLAIKSIRESFGAINGEVIVSDYGSDDGQVKREDIEASGARYIYTETDGTWSRSRALNAGFAIADGSVLVSTDADMIFSPHSFEVIGQILLSDPSLCLLLQCRDLPETLDDQAIHDSGFQWETFDSAARLRPRWGMGGMMAVHREVFARIRGLDERMHTYGGEDIDFARRAQRAGQRLLWVDHPNVRMYHMWHPSTKAVLEDSEEAQEAQEAIQYNRNIVYNDKSFVRNTGAWTHRLSGTHPLVSVAIATHNRAHYLSESIVSVLGQTMQDFEIVVVDDGSTDNTREVVESFKDDRIRYFYQERAGVAAARNRALEESLGQYTAVLDDDDLMTPWRLQSQLDALEVGLHGTFGAFVNFDDATGEMTLYRSKALNAGTIDETGGAPGHGTWLFETSILRRLRYDESLPSGVDNNLALRLVRSGFKFAHSGEVVMMRRMHPGQVTVSDEHTQKLAARQSRQFFSFGITSWGSNKMKSERGPEDWTKIRLSEQLEAFLPFLPDHLVRRRLRAPDLVPAAQASDGVRVFEDGELLGALLPAHEITSRQLAELTSGQHDFDVVAELRSGRSDDSRMGGTDTPRVIEEYVMRLARQALVDCEKPGAVVAIALAEPKAILDHLSSEAFVFTSREFRYEGGRKDYTVVVDPVGQEWTTWLTTGRFRVSDVISGRELDISSLTANVQDAGGSS